MSGAYTFLSEHEEDWHSLARLFAAQLTYGGEPVNHYAALPPALMGVVTPDKLGNGVLPRYIESDRLWLAHLGTLYGGALEQAWYAKHPGVDTLAAVFARLYRTGELAARLPRLNGAFFVMLWDPVSKVFTAFNDRYGLYPMYWAEGAGRFCLGSRVLCSVLGGVVPGTWDASGAAMLLTTDEFYGDTTLVQGVSCFPPATLLERAAGANSWTRYWVYDYSPRHANRPIPELAEALGDGLTQAVKRQTAGVDRIGVTLSGGLDSRSIVAAGARASIPMKTFTWGNRGCYDRCFAAQVAARHGTEHADCEYAVDNMAASMADVGQITEGLINYFDCHMMFHLDVMAQHTDVVLNGYAGDVLLGGSYLRPAWMGGLSTAELAERLARWRNSSVPDDRLEEALAGFPSRQASEDALSAQFQALLRPFEGLSTPDRVDRFVLENRQRRLTAMGTVIMRARVESAACFFDYDLVDLITGIPAAIRSEHRIYLAMLRQAFPDAAKLRWQRTLLPAGAPAWAAIAAKAVLKGVRIAERYTGWPGISNRQSPVAVDTWLRGPLRPWMEEVCHGADATLDEILRPEFRQSAWAAHLAGANRVKVLGEIAALRAFSGALAKARARTAAREVMPKEVSSRTDTARDS